MRVGLDAGSRLLRLHGKFILFGLPVTGGRNRRILKFHIDLLLLLFYHHLRLLNSKCVEKVRTVLRRHGDFPG